MKEHPKQNTLWQISHGFAPKETRMLKALLGLVLLLGVCFALYNVLRATYRDSQVSRLFPRKWVNLNEEGYPAAAVPTGGPAEKLDLRVAVAPIVSPEKSLEMYQDFIGYVAEKLRRNPISLYRATYSEVNNLVRYKLCDIAFVSTYPFMRGEREFGMQALVVPQIHGGTRFQSFILVPQSSSAASLLDLRGKRFGSADIISVTGWLFPAMILTQHGENPNRFFGEHVITGSHDRSIQAAADGFVDGAAVSGIVYDQMATENPSILKKIRILAKSPFFGNPPLVVHPDMDKSLRSAVLSILLNMHVDGRGKPILDKLQIERFVIPEKGLYDNLRKDVCKLEGWR